MVMKLIKAQLILDPEHDQDTAGHSDGQPCDVDEGKRLVSLNIPESHFEVIFKHDNPPVK